MPFDGDLIFKVVLSLKEIKSISLYLHCRKSGIPDDRIAFGFFLLMQNRGIYSTSKIQDMFPHSQPFKISSTSTVIL